MTSVAMITSGVTVFTSKLAICGIGAVVLIFSVTIADDATTVSVRIWTCSDPVTVTT
jgi:hypothetical protein